VPVGDLYPRKILVTGKQFDSATLRSNHNTTEAQQRYNGLMAESLKVPKDQFEAVIKALLKAPPMPLSDIPRKREPKAQPKRDGKKKRG
jgi:hypothetical protein